DRKSDRLDRIDAYPALQIERIRATRQRLVAGAVDRRNLVTDEILADRAADMHAPVGGRAELRAVDQRLLDEAIAIQALVERNPRQVGRTDTDPQLRSELRLQERLLDVNEHVLARAVG